jgi:2-polyprenyl-3-methyl-5-hydroxy-6-metoxy-1,4-benzoquinol methylase
MQHKLTDKWNAIYTEGKGNSEPASVLADHLFLLPKSGRALDLACGLGENALLLAKQGLATEAWDISDCALQKLQKKSIANALSIHTCTRKITADSFVPNTFDVIVISRFLDRSICDAIMKGLKFNGLLFYQTYTQCKSSELGPKNPRFLLAENELLTLFFGLTVVAYTEYANLGLLDEGLRNEAQFIGRQRR